MKYPRRICSVIAAFLMMVAVGGCAETAQQEATGKGKIRGINSIVTAPELTFLIEERVIGNANFKQAAGFAEYDNLTYNFNFDIFLPDAGEVTRLATQMIDVVIDTEYTVVIAGTIAAPTIISWEMEERVWVDTDTVFEADLVHLSPALGEVDVYFLPLGTEPTAGGANGTLNFGERIPYQEFPDGSRELFITLKDDPSNHLYRSPPISSTAASRVTFAIFDPDPSITSGIAVNLITSNGGSANIPNVNTSAIFRLLHAAFGTGNIDGYLDNDFGNIIFQNVGFGELSAYSDINTAGSPFTVTDTGNSGAPVHEAEVSIGGNSKHTIIFNGEPGALAYWDIRDEARPLEIFPIVRISNASVNVGVVSIYMLPPGTVIDEDTLTQFAGLPRLLNTGFMTPAAGIHEITIAPFGEITPISTPITIDIANGDVVDIAILDTADPAVVDLFIFNSTLP